MTRIEVPSRQTVACSTSSRPTPASGARHATVQPARHRPDHPRNFEVVSGPEFNDQLGKANQVVLEVEVEDASGTNPTVTVRYLHCNSGKKFAGLAPLVNGASIATGALPFRDVKTQAGPLGAQGQVGVTLAGTDPVARVRVWACGRSE